MFRITAFLNVHQEKLHKDLRGFGFTNDREGVLMLKMDQAYLRIRPISNQHHKRTNVGYHIYSNSSIETIFYFLDMLLPCYQPSITGVEYQFKNDESITPSEIRKLGGKMHNPSIYFIKSVGIVFLPQNVINMQCRGRYNLKQTYECMKEINRIEQELVPDTFDLFSYLGEAI